jgi:hypothetical protein
MDFQCIVGTYGAGVLKLSLLLQPVKKAFNGLTQAAHAVIVVLFPRVQFLAFELFLRRAQQDALGRQFRGQRLVAISLVAEQGRQRRVQFLLFETAQIVARGLA